MLDEHMVIIVAQTHEQGHGEQACAEETIEDEAAVWQPGELHDAGAH